MKHKKQLAWSKVLVMQISARNCISILNWLIEGNNDKLKTEQIFLYDVNMTNKHDSVSKHYVVSCLPLIA